MTDQQEHDINEALEVARELGYLDTDIEAEKEWQEYSRTHK